MLETLKRSLETCPIVKKGEYRYFVHPITDGVPFLTKGVLDDIIDTIVQTANLDCDKLVTVEAMGIPLTTLLTQRTGIPSVIIRKRPYGFEGEYEVTQKTGYSKSPLYINGLQKGDRIVFVDDVISTGGTLLPLMRVFKEMGIEVVDIVIVFSKVKDMSVMEEEIGKKIRALVTVDVQEDRVVVLD